MVNVFKIKKGLDINLKGKAERIKVRTGASDEFVLSPASFEGVVPKVVVREGEHVDAGQALFVNKQYPDVGFASPVSGVVTEIARGERRKVLYVKISADSGQTYADYGVHDVSRMSGTEVKDMILKAGLFGFIEQLPYAISAVPCNTPKAIFVSALRDKPLAADFEFELEGNEADFQTGLTALSRMAKVYLGIGARQTSPALTEARDVEINVFSGPCPAGNVGVQVNHISPVNKGETVWTADPTTVIFIGRLFNTGRVDMRRTVAVVGSEVENPAYTDVIVGGKISPLLEGRLKEGAGKLRIIDGNVLTGRKTTSDGYIGAHSSEITVIPEGDDADEFIGWIMPRLNQYSANRSYFSWLSGKKKYVLDARVKGGERHIIMSGEYDRVMPMDICAEYLVKAIISGDIDKMEELGIYEVAPEDFALAEFVDSSKLELQHIVRAGLDMLRKENA